MRHDLRSVCRAADGLDCICQVGYGDDWITAVRESRAAIRQGLTCFWRKLAVLVREGGKQGDVLMAEEWLVADGQANEHIAEPLPGLRVLVTRPIFLPNHLGTHCVIAPTLEQVLAIIGQVQAGI